jgi:hypothetical protein
VFDILRLLLDYSARDDRFVPHDLTEIQRRERVGKSTALISVLANAKGVLGDLSQTKMSPGSFTIQYIPAYGFHVMLIPLKWQSSESIPPP